MVMAVFFLEREMKDNKQEVQTAGPHMGRVLQGAGVKCDIRVEDCSVTPIRSRDREEADAAPCDQGSLDSNTDMGSPCSETIY